jgi:ribonuclease HI
MQTLKGIHGHSTEEVIKGKQILLSGMSDVSETSQRMKSPEKKWVKPFPGWVKLNCDGSFRVEDGTAGAGMILRDEDGQIVFSSCRQLFQCLDPLEAEAKACHKGLMLALQLSNKPIQVELDCLGLTEAIKEKQQNRSPILHVISEIKELVSGSTIISSVKGDQSQNRASHYLANLVRVEGRIVVWIGSGLSVCLKF